MENKLPGEDVTFSFLELLERAKKYAAAHIFDITDDILVEIPKMRVYNPAWHSYAHETEKYLYDYDGVFLECGPELLYKELSDAWKAAPNYKNGVTIQISHNAISFFPRYNNHWENDYYHPVLPNQIFPKHSTGTFPLLTLIKDIKRAHKD